MKSYQIPAMSLWFALCAVAQVKTEVPPVVSGAKPAAVERIKVHGVALEGNLENDAVDRDVIVFLPPSYATDKSRRYPVVYALHGYFGDQTRNQIDRRHGFGLRLMQSGFQHGGDAAEPS